MQSFKGYHNSGKGLLTRSKNWTATFILITATLVISSGTAYAGLFSFLVPIVEGMPVSAKVVATTNNAMVIENSQTIALLQAAANIDPNPNKLANIDPIIADNTLDPDLAANNVADTDQTSTQISAYIVRQGDTVSGIARMFNVSVNTVLWANNLTSKSILQAGRTLVILPVSGIMYTVKRGDTVSSIAKKYGADANDITAYNDLSVSTLVVGQSIIIPDAEFNVSQTAQINSQGNSNSGSSGTSVLVRNAQKLPSYPGYYLRPITGGRLSQSLHPNNAVDLAAPMDTPIRASAAGTVIISRINGNWNGGYGNFIVISHDNGTQTLYSHMQSRGVVSLGDHVEQGQTIGFIGISGRTTGPHVHFEIRGARNPF